MTYSIKYKPLKQSAIRNVLKKIDFKFSAMQDTFWKATRNKVNVVCYESGKLVIQGNEATKINNYLIDTGLVQGEKEEIKKQEVLKYSKWIGTDESGKGDYYGALVVGGVMIKEDVKDTLINMGVKDSKDIPDERIILLAKEIKKLTCHFVGVIKPSKYNKLMAIKERNLNHLLARSHARVIKRILSQESCEFAIADKFGNEKYLNDALIKEKIKIDLKQKENGEDDIGVACASILAREGFLKSIESLNRKYKLVFPKGASNTMIPKIGKEFVAKYGKDKLGEVAKLHFKTTNKII